jgi:uncharacterized protein YjbI with pentapeptide repeats
MFGRVNLKAVISFSKNKRISFVMFFAAFLLPILACEDTPIDQTDIAPDNLEGGDFSHSSINQYDFSEKNLRDVDFSYSTLMYNNFSDADLRDANLSYSILTGSNFTGANLQGAKLEGICDLDEIIWIDAKLDDKWKTIIELFGAGQRPPSDLQGFDLAGLCMTHTNFDNVNFQNANIAYANFAHSSFENAQFQNADLYKTSFSEANLRNANLTNANFSYANLSGAIVDKQQLGDATLLCTRLPDNTVYDEQRCIGDAPGP